MVRNPLFGRWAGVALVLVLVATCSDEPTELPHPASVSVVAPATLSLTVGDTLRLAADVRDQWGIEHPGAAVAWSSSDSRVTSVDPAGLVTATGVGTATITATAGNASGSVQLSASATPSDREILEILYHATDGDNWVNNEKWLTDAELEEWYGVEADSAGRVLSLDLSGGWDSEIRQMVPHGLAGPIPPELGYLANLTNLSLLHNQLTGSIPPELGNLANLTTLALSANELTGSIPPELGNLANLTTLALAINELRGSIPPELGNLANLTTLGLAINELTGPIPPDFGNLTNLQYLNISSNNLVGPIPTELGNLTDLLQFELYRNNLTGPIPTELGNLTDLFALDLFGNNLTGPVPPELGNLANLTTLGLAMNELTGPIPPDFGNLTNLRYLNIARNNLTGPIPRSFLQLGELRFFYMRSNESLCVPGIPSFFEWLHGISNRDEGSVYCNADDVAALMLLYETADGPDWDNAAGWEGGGAVEEWYGVDADSLGRVVTLDLADNGLNGGLPQTMGNLTEMRVLRIGDNDLSGRLPGSLVNVPLREFQYADTNLCAPTTEWFQAWLNSIQSYEGTGVECPPLSDREILEILYESTGGASWSADDKWLTDAPLSDWRGVVANGQGDVTWLSLADNNLTGRIPPELSDLANLTRLVLAFNDLSGSIPPQLGNLTNLQLLNLWSSGVSGPIPPELGNLANLWYADLDDNDLTGTIPPELGNLASLQRLYIGGNDLTGAIPSEFGNLANLTHGSFDNNDLTGSIPPELGNLANLLWLDLRHNALSGPIPPQLGNLTSIERLFLNYNQLEGGVPPSFGGMSSLRALGLANNGDMAGALPAEMTRMSQLNALAAGGTGLCAPTGPAFQTWLAGVYRRRIKQCVEADPPAAYLVQAVQSREFPVPLVAGERALLRVFPTARLATDATMPAVRARFYRAGIEVQIEIPGKSTPIPTEVDEGSLSNSANAEIPDYLIWPGLEMVIEIDPYGTLDDSLEVAKRIPETGRLALDVREMPVLDLTLIPFIWTETHDSSIVGLAGEMAADPHGHEMFSDMHLLPVGDLAVTAHEPVLSTSNSAFDLLRETVAIRAMEGGTGHYKGMMSPPVTGAGGVARLPGRSSFSQPYPGVIAHELGHNLDLYHAPCGGAGGPDPSFPYSDGTTGAWGYDFREGELMHPGTRDLMSYCGPKWISDYHFTNALNFRLSDADSVGLPRIAGNSESLLLWGGIDADSVPFLEPAFVVDAPPTLPDSAGDYRLTGHSDTGTELFSLSFDMPVVADGDGSSSFAFVLPAEASWVNSLATITLTSPGGSVTLDSDSNHSMAILRDPQTGQVRAILRDVPAAIESAADAVGGMAGQGLEVLFSRGIPSVDAWRR